MNTETRMPPRELYGNPRELIAWANGAYDDPTYLELKAVREAKERLEAELRGVRAERDELAAALKAAGRDPVRVLTDPRDERERRYVETLERLAVLQGKAEELMERQARLILAMAGEEPGSPWASAIWPHVAGSKALTDATYAVPPPVPIGVVETPRRARFVRQLIPSTTLEVGDRFAFMRQTVRTLQAAPVPANQTKPTSTVTAGKVEDRVRTIAHISEPVNRFDLLDFAGLRDFLEAELRLGLLLAEDAQIIAGDGTGENMTGILNTAGILTVARGSESRQDAIRKAITALEKQHVTPTVVLLHPDDAEELFTEKDSSGQYLFAQTGSPLDPRGRTIWGLDVFSTMAMPTGTALVADFRAGARLYVRDDAIVEFNDSHADLFAKNQVIARAEERIGLAVLRPMAFCTVTNV